MLDCLIGIMTQALNTGVKVLSNLLNCLQMMDLMSWRQLYTRVWTVYYCLTTRSAVNCLIIRMLIKVSSISWSKMK